MSDIPRLRELLRKHHEQDAVLSPLIADDG